MFTGRGLGAPVSLGGPALAANNDHGGDLFQLQASGPHSSDSDLVELRRGPESASGTDISGITLWATPVWGPLVWSSANRSVRRDLA